MTDTWTNRLSEYMDGELSPTEQRELEAHLVECRECVQTLAELRAVAERARALQDQPPARDLWTGIATRIRSDAASTASVRSAVTGGRGWRARRFVLSVPQLLAAGIALMLISAGGVWLALSSRSVGPVAMLPAGLDVAPAVTVEFVTPDYNRAVAELEHVLAEHRSELDSVTVRALEESLATIDQAIAEARAALAEDPSNRYVNAHLADALRLKLELLRRAAAIATAVT